MRAVQAAVTNFNNGEKKKARQVDTVCVVGCCMGNVPAKKHRKKNPATALEDAMKRGVKAFKDKIRTRTNATPPRVGTPAAPACTVQPLR